MDSSRPTEFAKRLERSLARTALSDLASDPVGAVARLGIKVCSLTDSPTTEDCSCDGAYFHYPTPTIVYAPTKSRRENFTVLHEFGHHLVRNEDDLLSYLADQDDDGGRALEERVCDAFAGRVLIPDDLVAATLDGRQPEARDVVQLFSTSEGSREACCVRLSERLASFGYIAILDAGRHEVVFAAASGSCPYVWRRGSSLPGGHPVWRAAERGNFRGEGEVIWEGGRKDLWLDAVIDGDLVVAVFAEDRHWPDQGLGLLRGASITSAREIAITGDCRHCGARTWGYRACAQCGDVRCRSCGKCGCGASPAALRERRCNRCFLVKASSQFVDTSDICSECR